MKNKGKIIMVCLDQLIQTVNVRVALDQERVAWFVAILNAGGDTEPAWITDDNQIIDGRTRLAAYELCNKKEMPVIKKGMLSEEEITYMAIEANFGGPKPPSITDVNFTIISLLKGGEKRKNIVERFSKFIPAKFVSNMVDESEKQIRSELMRKARIAVSKGKSIKGAAEEYNVSEIALGKAIAGKDDDAPKASNHEMTQTKSAIHQHTKDYVKKAFTYKGARFTKFAADGVFTSEEINSMLSFLNTEKESLVKNFETLILRIKNTQKNTKE